METVVFFKLTRKCFHEIYTFFNKNSNRFKNYEGGRVWLSFISDHLLFSKQSICFFLINLIEHPKCYFFFPLLRPLKSKHGNSVQSCLVLI